MLHYYSQPQHTLEIMDEKRMCLVVLVNGLVNGGIVLKGVANYMFDYW